MSMEIDWDIDILYPEEDFTGLYRKAILSIVTEAGFIPVEDVLFPTTPIEAYISTRTTSFSAPRAMAEMLHQIAVSIPCKVIADQYCNYAEAHREVFIGNRVIRFHPHVVWEEYETEELD